MNTIWSPTSNHKTIPHSIYYNLSGWIRDLTTPNHCLKNSRASLQETKNQRSSSRTQKICCTPSTQEPRTLLNCILPRNFVPPWWTSTHNSRTQSPHQLISHTRKIFKKIQSSSRNFQTPLSLKNSSTIFLSFLLLKNILI